MLLAEKNHANSLKGRFTLNIEEHENISIANETFAKLVEAPSILNKHYFQNYD